MRASGNFNKQYSKLKMELIKKIKIKTQDNFVLKILLTLVYPIILFIGIILMIFVWITSIFQSKKTVDKVIIKEEEWTYFAEYETTKIQKKYLSEIRFGPAYFSLKSEPNIYDFKNKIFGDWFFKFQNFLFLQQWNSTDKPNTNLLVIDFKKKSIKSLENNLNSVLWEMKNEDDGNLNLICNTGYEIKTYQIKKTAYNKVFI